jgi:hypothetical protein
LCDGQNNTPDLRGRVLIGLDKNDVDYSSIGKTGGLRNVELTVDQMPSHTHIDQGHSHDVDLNTDSSGLHHHFYKDTFWSETVKNWVHQHINTSDNPYGWGGNTWMDQDNVGWDKDRSSELAGSHQHNVKGNTYSSNSRMPFLQS